MTPDNAAPKFEREERYIVIKRKSLNEQEEGFLRHYLDAQAISTVECVVVEDDWPECETVFQMIEARVTGKALSAKLGRRDGVSESIFSGLGFVIPMADVSHIERHWYQSDTDRTRDNYRGLIIVTKQTTWNTEIDGYQNSIYIPAGEEAESFLACWCHYRHELEGATLKNLAAPTEDSANG